MEINLFAETNSQYYSDGHIYLSKKDIIELQYFGHCLDSADKAAYLACKPDLFNRYLKELHSA